MKRRIFIAINLPEKIKERLFQFKFKFAEVPARWVKKENLHLTLAFLGYLNEEEIAKICQLLKELVPFHRKFILTLKKVSYGLVEKSIPRLIWVNLKKSENLKELKKNLDKKLKEAGFRTEERKFIPHITLARIKRWEFKAVELEDRVEINENLNLTFKVNSIQLMESKLKRGGPIYEVLSSESLS